jgi:hypothetical protein
MLLVQSWLKYHFKRFQGEMRHICCHFLEWIYCLGSQKFPVTQRTVQMMMRSLYISRNLKGIIVTLDETGYIYCSYLGTDPSLFVTPPAQSRDVKYDVS